MNELIKTGAVCLMASMMTGCAFADAAKVAPPKKENKPQDLITAIIEETKLADDGSISYEEFKAARETVIKKRVDEMKAAREKRDKEKFLSLDKNKDGKVSKTELLELQKQFDEGGHGRFGRGRSRGPQGGPQGAGGRGQHGMRQGIMEPGMGQGMGRHGGQEGAPGLVGAPGCKGECPMGNQPGMGKGRGPQGSECKMNCDNNGPHRAGQGQQSGFGRGKGQKGGGRPGMRGQGRPGLEMIMIQADTDKDGSFSKEEVKAAVLQFFDKLDANKDGKLDKSELPAGRHGGRKMRVPENDTKGIPAPVDKTE